MPEAMARLGVKASAVKPSAVKPGSYLAFDYGTRRVGVATGNTVTATATPLTTIAAEGDARFEAIARLLAQWQPDGLVVGVPVHPDGQPHENTRRALRFARQLQGRFGLPVQEVDERYTTTAAHSAGARGDAADAAAAAIILQQFLNPLDSRDAVTLPGALS